MAAARDFTGSVPRLPIGWLHLAVLWAFAFAKPLFDVLADSPEFFVARGNKAVDVVLLGFALTLIPPTVLIVVEAFASLVPTLRAWVHLLFVAVLAGAFALQTLVDLGDGSAAPLLTVAIVAGVGFAVAYARIPAVPLIVTVLGPVPLIFLGLFLLVSPVSDIVLPQDAEAAARAKVRARTPVVLVVFDELESTMLMDSRQRLDRTRYPQLAALADEATWYRNATTVADRTLRAVPALLSGTRPPAEGLPVASNYPNTVFSLLGDTHSMHVTETATELCPVRLCGERVREGLGPRLRSLVSDLSVVSLHLLLPEALRSRLPAVDQTFGDFRQGETEGAAPSEPAGFLTHRLASFNRFVREIKPGRGRPGFHFLHIALPHAPWQYLPSGQRYPQSGPDYPGLGFDTWTNDPAPVRLGLQRHLLQAGFADRLVGRMVRRLKRTGLYDRALVIVTADHGVSYRPGQPRREMTRTTAADIAAVPLLVKYPHQRAGEVDDSSAETVDVVPTIADALGASLPWAADGRPLRGPRGRERDVRVAVSPSGDLISLPPAEFERERATALRRMIRTFGSGDGASAIFAAGPHPELLGRRSDGLAVGTDPPGRFELDAPELFRSVRPAASSVPSLITGTISADLGEGRPLALALNGRIRATTASFRDDGKVRLAAMVHPHSFRAGSNGVEAFLVERAGRSVRLVRLAPAP